MELPRHRTTAGRQRDPTRLPRALRDDLANKSNAIATVSVLPSVGQTRKELSQNASRTGIEFHSVHSRSDGQRRRLTEAGYQLVDFRLLHCHRQLTRHRVGHSGRSPQHRLGVCARSLHPGMTEPGQNQRSVRSTCSRDRLPPRATFRRQRCPLVRPVVLRYRGHFGDDDPGSALGAALVVRTVPIGKRASHSKIGLVRTENNPGPDEASGQGRVFVKCQLTALSEP